MSNEELSKKADLIIKLLAKIATDRHTSDTARVQELVSSGFSDTDIELALGIPSERIGIYRRRMKNAKTK